MYIYIYQSLAFVNIAKITWNVFRPHSSTRGWTGWICASAQSLHIEIWVLWYTVVYCGILWYCVWEWFNSNHTVTIDNHSVYGLIWFNYNLWYRIVSGYGFTMFYTYNNCSWMNIHIPQGYRVLTRTHIHPWWVVTLYLPACWMFLQRFNKGLRETSWWKGSTLRRIWE